MDKLAFSNLLNLYIFSNKYIDLKSESIPSETFVI